MGKFVFSGIWCKKIGAVCAKNSCTLAGSPEQRRTFLIGFDFLEFSPYFELLN
jgi:hypothetical protein